MMGYQFQIFGNSWEKNCIKRYIYKKTMITTKMRICKRAHCRRECVEVTNCVMMDEYSGRKKDN